MNRREFIATGAACAALAVSPESALGKPKKRNTLSVFTKPLQMLSYDDLADVIAQMGFDGIEGTIRPGGQITPEQVPDELPKMIVALKKRGLEMTIMASGVNDSRDKVSMRQLEVAAKLGVKRYRMKYFKYDLKRPVAGQLDEIRPQLKDLVAVNKALGIQAVYQNHSGSNYFGAPLWDLWLLFKEHPVEHLAVALDTGHTTVEGTNSWPIQANLLRPHLGALYVKDYTWIENKKTLVPLGHGNIDSGYPRRLLKSGYTGPVNLHVEYLKPFSKENVPKQIAAIKRDAATLRKWLGWS
jgi:sugar phosphate isomerase/epimerase